MAPAAICRFVQLNGGGERALAWVAAQQLGLISAPQLRLAAVGYGLVESRCARGMMQRLHRGVYLVGPAPLHPGAPELAGVLACGPGALISGRSGAALWGLATPPPDCVELTVIGRNIRSRAGLKVHRKKWLDEADRTVKAGIPVTAPARTLVDFAAAATYEELEYAVAEAKVLGLLSDRRIVAAIDRAPQAAGVATLRRILASPGGPAFTRSDAERQLLRLIREGELPIPSVNARVRGRELDFLWPAQRLATEVDGHRYHGHRLAFERDRKRDAALVASGYRVLRFTWRQIMEEPLLVIANLARALERGAVAAEAERRDVA